VADVGGGAPAPASVSIVWLIREEVLDAELAALVWLLSDGGLPVNLAGEDAELVARLADGLRDVASEVTVVEGASLEDVLASTRDDPALLGVVLVAGRGRVVASHYVRPALRDAGGHLRPQNPAVLSTWEVGLGSFEHFAWGVIPELAERTRQRPGDFEVEHGRRREFLTGLAAAGLVASSDVRTALAGYRSAAEVEQRH
jgi:hypothetical protein